MTQQFKSDLNRASKFHGHVCTGIILGTRIARLGLKYLGITDPLTNRDFFVYCEINGCMTDAIQSVAYVSIGNRRLKLLNYGKMAASFIDKKTNQGVRIAVSTEQILPKDSDPIAFWEQFSNDELFQVLHIKENIQIDTSERENIVSTFCDEYHEKIKDARYVIKDGKTLCEACVNGAYYIII